nr:MAG: hypothetical protein 2 [Leviviridae sp.]
MSTTIPASITGAAQTGFTSPTYTTVVDTQPDFNAKQSYVSAAGGTQTGVTIHSVSSPFTLAFWKPKIMKMLGVPNPTTGVISSVPRNTYKCITRKGVTPAANQVAEVMVIRTEIDVPAGADTFDIANVRAALSAHIGLLSNQSAGLGDTAQTGTL